MNDNKYKYAYEKLKECAELTENELMLEVIEMLDKNLQEPEPEPETTKAEIMKIKDNAKRQQAIRENLELFS